MKSGKVLSVPVHELSFSFFHLLSLPSLQTLFTQIGKGLRLSLSKKAATANSFHLISLDEL